MIEFLLAALLLILPLLFGTFIIGMRLVRANQVEEVCRDAGHMYAYGINLSQASGQNLLVDLAQGLNLTPTGGNGVIILSTIIMVGPNDCDAGGSTNGTCNNLNQTVFTGRIVIGNPNLTINNKLQMSAFGTPTAAIVNSSGYILPADYSSNSGALANNFSNVITLVPGQVAYVAEAYFASPDFGLLYPGAITARAIF